MNDQLTNFTFLARTAPYGNNRSNLLMDIALASSVFEQKSNYVFMDDAIYQLLRNQNADHIQTKTFGKAIEAIKLYGINNIYVYEKSLKERSVSLDELVLNPEIINQKQLQKLIRNSENVISL
tara:strand:+ start:847 stop:1215 length:369 start_codon:yes stop_codon:yes gene_type:complete